MYKWHYLFGECDDQSIPNTYQRIESSLDLQWQHLHLHPYQSGNRYDFRLDTCCRSRHQQCTSHRYWRSQRDAGEYHHLPCYRYLRICLICCRMHQSEHLQCSGYSQSGNEFEQYFNSSSYLQWDCFQLHPNKFDAWHHFQLESCGCSWYQQCCRSRYR